MTTVQALCSNALTDSGIIGSGQVAGAEDSNTALRLANGLLSQWNRKRWLVYSLTDVSFVSTGAEIYTVGPGGDFDTPRPDRLEDGNFMRQINTNSGNEVDYPMQLIQSHEDYNRIRLKSMGTWPSCVWYDSKYPIGEVRWWPVPQASIYELHLLVKNQLTQFASLAQAIILPPEYEVCLSYNLQVRLRAAYRLPADPVLIGLAKDALNVLRLANTQVPTLRMPMAVVGAQRAYNVFSDGY